MYHLETISLVQNYPYEEADIPALDETSAVIIVSSPKVSVITVTDNAQVTVHQL